MNQADIIAKLRAHEADLRAAGVTSLSIVGSMARHLEREDSDIDVLVRLADEPARAGFGYFGRLDELSRRLENILGRPVDVIAEPVRKERLRREFAEDRTVAF